MTTKEELQAEIDRIERTLLATEMEAEGLQKQLAKVERRRIGLTAIWKHMMAEEKAHV
jgi:hypothetical protein